MFYIPSPALRRRVLQHELWRVRDSPFFVTELRAEFSLNPPSLAKAPIWVTIQDIPFDLVTDEGSSYILRPLGKVVDAKPFTCRDMGQETSSDKESRRSSPVWFWIALVALKTRKRESLFQNLHCPSPLLNLHSLWQQKLPLERLFTIHRLK